MKKALIVSLQTNIKKSKHCIQVHGKNKELIPHSQDKINYKIKSFSHNKKKLIMIHFKDSSKNQKYRFIKRIIISNYYNPLDSIYIQ
jgi:protein-arginine kinase